MQISDHSLSSVLNFDLSYAIIISIIIISCAGGTSSSTGRSADAVRSAASAKRASAKRRAAHTYAHAERAPTQSGKSYVLINMFVGVMFCM